MKTTKIPHKTTAQNNNANTKGQQQKSRNKWGKQQQKNNKDI